MMCLPCQSHVSRIAKSVIRQTAMMCPPLERGLHEVAEHRDEKSDDAHEQRARPGAHHREHDRQALMTATASSRNDSISGVYSRIGGRIWRNLAGGPMAETRGTNSLRKAGVEHTLMRYSYRPGGGAEQAADELGVERERMYKSLVARAGEELVFALVPATSELSLKKLAAAAGEARRDGQPARRRARDRLPGRRDQPAGIAPAHCGCSWTRAASGSSASA